MSRWILCSFVTLLLSLPASDASADRIRTLSKRLAESSSAKVRISAALSLAKTSDKRAIMALSTALRDDSDAAIRRISAASLGQRLDDEVDKRTRKKAITALQDAAKSDRDTNVRSSAKVALTKVSQGAGAARPSAARSRGLLVGVAQPTNLSRRLPKKTASLLQATVKQVIRDKAPSSIQTAPGTGMPSSQQLKKSGMAGFSVTPDISKLNLVRKGKRVMVQCEVKMRLSPWEGQGERWVADETATVTGSGTVTSGNSSRAVSDSTEACITAVVTQVTSSQVVPFLAQKAR